jgi:carboxymethylenebutenolidase
MTAMAAISLPYFVARPAGDGPSPGVVVIHEANGVTPQLLRVCQRLAAEGYTALAPDLFFRVGGSEADEYMKLVGSLSEEQVEGDLLASAQLLREMGSPKVGITGFCMGGRWSWHMAVTSTAFDAAAGFYGSGIVSELRPPNCPTKLFFGGQDPWIPMDQITEVAGYHADTTVYDEAGHGFMRDGSDDFSEAAAADAWQQTLALFQANLH